ncbi:hypothetical protein D3227_37395 [Mesorhizobium waimense]|uniref:Uncharacterized protein n=1 Tax=Mesorhizobium waimense TaxID=1300307 RepID=A0A3A5JW92_9HYPH|nr:hypothetical protein D3227_37395 [Mesorhizobium waimense]
MAIYAPRQRVADRAVGVAGDDPGEYVGHVAERLDVVSALRVSIDSIWDYGVGEDGAKSFADALITNRSDLRIS